MLSYFGNVHANATRKTKHLPGIIYRAGTANRCRAAVGYIRYTTRIINTIG